VDDVGAAVRAAVADSPQVVFAPLIPGDPDERVSLVQRAFCEQDAGGHLAADRYWSFGDPLRSNFVSEVMGSIPCDPGEAAGEMLAGYESMAAAFEVDLGSADFQAAYAADFGQLPTIFANTAYDAAVLVMLAAEEARSLDSLAIRDHMVSVSTGGAPVSDFAEALSLVRAGVDIDWAGTYEGVATGFTYDINHDFEPDGETILPYLISRIQSDGTMPIAAVISADDLRTLSDP
jgi:hypothetical protein